MPVNFSPTFDELMRISQLISEAKQQTIAKAAQEAQKQKLADFMSNFQPQQVMVGPQAQFSPQPQAQIGQYLGGQFNMPQSPLSVGMMAPPATPAPDLQSRTLNLQPNPQEAFRNAAMQDPMTALGLVGEPGLRTAFGLEKPDQFKPNYFGSPDQGIYATTPEGGIEQKLAPQGKIDDGDLPIPGFVNTETNTMVTWDGKQFIDTVNGKPIDASKVTKASAASLTANDAILELPIDMPYNENGLNPQVFDIAISTGQLSKPQTIIAKKIAEYKMKPIETQRLLKDPNYAKIMQGVVAYDSRFDTKYYRQRMKTVDSFSGQGKDQQLLNRFNTAVSHLGRFKENADKLNNLGLKVANTPLNALKKQYSAEVQRLIEDRDALAGELSYVYKGQNTSDEEIKVWRDNLSINMTPAQFKAAIDEVVKLMLGRMQASIESYMTGMNYLPNEKDRRFLTQDARSIFKSLGYDPDIIDYVNPNYLSDSGASQGNSQVPDLSKYETP